MKKILKLYSYFALPIDEVDQEKGKILWLLRLRWIVLAIQFIVIIPILLSEYQKYEKIILYIGICFGLFFFNLLVWGIWKKNTRSFSESLTFINLMIDLLAFSALYSFVINTAIIPIESLYLIHVALGAILLNRKLGFAFYTLTALLYLSIQIHQYQNFKINNLSIAMFNQLVLFIIWFISRSVSKHVLYQREKLNHLMIYTEKMDRLRAIGALTAGFSHEFATPLNTIKLRLNRIEKKINFESEDIKSALIAVESCEKVIKHINLAQIDKRDFIFQNINIIRALEEITKSWLEDYPDASLKIIVPSDTSLSVELPVLNFSQGLLNVLDNAYESGSRNKIVIEVMAEKSKIKVNITDDGPGFPSEVLARFGEPFLTTKKAGTGLGLYSFELFAQSIGGGVTIENLSPRGAQVSFSCPIKKKRTEG